MAVCKFCGNELISGQNWFASMAKTNNRACKSCWQAGTRDRRRDAPGTLFFKPLGRRLRVSEAAYLAGILDGEGCISLASVERSACPTVDVANTNPRLIEWLEATFGGRVSVNKGQGNQKDVYIWSATKLLALRVLLAARPYLLLKKQQADILLGLGNEKHMGINSRGRDHYMLTDAQVQKNKEAIEQIRKLNKRGVA